jgi:membrane protease YdiL (CAAX protease family)
MLETMPTTNVRATRHSALVFLVAAVLFTWALQLPAVLAKVGVLDGPVERFVPIAALGGFGPFVAALFFARFEPGGPGIRGLFRRLLIWRVGAGWYAIALGLLPLIYVIGAALYRLADDEVAWFFPPENAQHVAALLVVPLVEEIGWRGFALPRLQQHYSATQASLIVGAAWSLYHVMMFVLQNVPATGFALGLGDVFVASILFSWIYNHTRGSLLLAVLAHAAAHLNNPAHAIPNMTPLAIQASALVILSGVLLAFDRKAWREPYVEQQL